MSKHGLGRGLGSLLSIYQTEPKSAREEKAEKIEREAETKVEARPIAKEKPIEELSTEINSTNDVLKNAKELLEKYSKKQPAETAEDEFVKKQQNIAEKLQKANPDELFADMGARQVPIGRLKPNPDQPRKNFDSQGLKELAQSIKEHGVIQPLVVVKKDDGYIIIAGERRFRACQLAGVKNVPVIVKDYNAQQIREIALIENLQREDLNPVETAHAIKQLIDIYNFTQEDVARRIGKSRPVIANTLRLLSLAPEVLTLVENGRLAPGLARSLVSIEDKARQIELAKKACDGKLTARELEKMVQEINMPEKGILKKKPQQSMELLAMRDQMQQIFGTKVTVLGSDKKGRIYLDYYNKDDLDRIYSILQKVK